MLKIRALGKDGRHLPFNGCLIPDWWFRDLYIEEWREVEARAEKERRWHEREKARKAAGKAITAARVENDIAA